MRLSSRRIAKRGVPGHEVEWPPPVGSEIRMVHGNHNDCIYHVRGHVDLDDGGGLVVRSWRYRRRWWAYEVFDDIWWDVNNQLNYNHLYVVLPKNVSS